MSIELLKGNLGNQQQLMYVGTFLEERINTDLIIAEIAEEDTKKQAVVRI
jgi:hypothetical protein